MAKFAIILCIVLVVSSARGGFIKKRLDAAQERISSLIDKSILRVKTEVEDAKQKAYETVGKVDKLSEEYKNKVKSDVSENFEKVKEEFDKVSGNVNGVDVTECAQLVNELEYTTGVVLSNISTCIVNKRKKAISYVGNIIRISDNVRDELAQLRGDARKCLDEKSTYTVAFLCTNHVAVKVPWAAGKATPAIAWNLAKITYLFTTLVPSLAICATTNGVTTIYAESSVLTIRANRCIRQKIDEIRRAEQNSRSTTERNVYTEKTTVRLTTEQPKEHLPTTEQPKENLPTTEQSKEDLSTTEQPKVDPSTPEQPKVDLSTTEQPKVDLPTSEQPKEDLPTSEQPKEDLPTSEQPKEDLPTSEQPKEDLSTTEKADVPNESSEESSTTEEVAGELDS